MHIVGRVLLRRDSMSPRKVSSVVREVLIGATSTPEPLRMRVVQSRLT